MRVSRLSLLVVLLTSCATTPHPPLPPPVCSPLTPFVCEQEAALALSQGRVADAQHGLGIACDAGRLDSCLALGRLFLAERKYHAAEPLLRRAHDAGMPGGYTALAELHETRAAPADDGYARTLRWDRKSVAQSPAEFLSTLRVGDERLGGAFTLVVQPMAVQSRRLYFGVQLAYGPATELNALLGYQHFVTDWFIPYTHVVTGGVWHEPSRGRPINFGAEAGVKLSLASVGHLSLGAGASEGHPGYFAVGLGVDYILFLVALAGAL